METGWEKKLEFGLKLQGPGPSQVPTPSLQVELADLLQKMLWDLQDEQEQLQEAAQTWARRGAALEAAVGQACAPRELERFIRFMADLERVLGLLLLLGSRLARVRRALARTGTDGDPDEQVKGFRLQESRAAKHTRLLTVFSPCGSRLLCCKDSGSCSGSRRTPGS